MIYFRGGAEVDVATSLTDVTRPDGDHLIGGPGADVLDGGESGDDPETDANEEHLDWAVYRPAKVDPDTNAGVTVNLATRMGEAGEAMGDTLINIELIWGSLGDDVFKASEGPDYVHGDTGSDTMSYELSDMGVNVSLVDDQPSAAFDGNPSEDDLGTAIHYIVDGTDQAFSDPGDPATEDEIEDNTNGAAGDRLGGIENLTGSDHNDVLVGDTNANTLMGGGGNDMLTGGAGDDKLHGGAGDDTLTGSSDMNTLRGDAGDDTINGGTGSDTIARRFR